MESNPASSSTPGGASAPRVFISYSSFDRAIAFQMMRLLQQRGCDVWLDFFDIKPAEVLDRELSFGIERAQILCLLLSPTSVASPWVAREIEVAGARKAQGLRILPVILRPCRIPDTLDTIVGIDVSAGLADEATELRLVKAVLGAGSVDHGVLLTAGQRAELAKVELRQQVDQRVPDLVRELDRVRDLPIRELSLALDLESFPADQTTILELRLVLDPLWSAPMSFWFARYREGATWPAEIGFAEPPYTDYYQARRPRVDCKLQWFDRVETPTLTQDSTDFAVGEVPPTFTVTFDGATFQPGGGGPHLPQKYELPSLRALVDHRSRFVLIAHHPATKSADEIDLALTDLDLSVTARFADAEPALVQIFRSRHREDEKVALLSQSLSAVGSAIERAALLDLCPLPGSAEDRGRKAKLLEAFDADQPVPEEDRRFAARLCFGEAQLSVVRNDPLRALQRFQRVAVAMQPIVLEGYPTYEEGVLMYRACANLVGYFIGQKNYARAADFVNGVGLVAQRLVNLDAAEPDYRRMWADALFTNALVHGETNDLSRATDELCESVETWRELHSALPNRERLVDARRALASAIELARKWRIEAQLPLDAWRRELDPDGTVARALDARAQAAVQGPAWLRPCDPSGWPTLPFSSPLLRYALRVPQRWSQTPGLHAQQAEVEHIFRGTRPTEWLIVDFMEKATGGNMRNWVDVFLAMAGFPVLAMAGDAKPGAEPGQTPRLLDWRYEGTFPDDARRLGLDELHGYGGVAQLPGDRPQLARIYIVLARRATFAWKVTLAFETATLPGMPAELVEKYDHVRAGAVLGALSFG